MGRWRKTIKNTYKDSSANIIDDLTNATSDAIDLLTSEATADLINDAKTTLQALMDAKDDSLTEEINAVKSRVSTLEIALSNLQGN